MRPENYDTALGVNIRTYRMYYKMTQEELGQKMNKSSSVIANWERSRNAPSIYDIYKLCDIFNCTPNNLFGYNESTEIKGYLLAYAERIAKLADLKKQKASLDEQIRYWNSKIPKP